MPIAGKKPAKEPRRRAGFQTAAKSLKISLRWVHGKLASEHAACIEILPRAGRSVRPLWKFSVASKQQS